MSMPETAVNEYGPSLRSIREIWRSWEISIADAKAQAERMGDRPNAELGSCIALANSREASGGLAIDDDTMPVDGANRERAGS